MPDARNWVRRTVALACLGPVGCAAPPAHSFAPAPAPARAPAPPAEPPARATSIQLARHEAPAAPTDPSPVARLERLTEADVVRAVLARNPTLDQMRAAAAAVAARYSQAAALDDPTATVWTAPGSAGSPNVNYAARVELAQNLPFPGKRGLKGSAARAEALAATEDVEDARLQLAEAARAALADLYLAAKATAVAEENAKLLAEFRKNAEARYKAGQGQQQDVLQAEVELARQEERLVALRRARAVAGARLNTLMHLPPDAPLPPPADPAPPGPPAPPDPRAVALARPDVRALVARVSADEAALELARREYKPDVELMAAYDGFWQGVERPLQWQLGVRTNLPVRYARRGAAVEEARARVAQRRAELARLTDQIALQVQEALERAREADEVVKLYESKVLPAAAANVKEARAAYANGRVPFINLIEAQRSATALRDRYYEAVAEALRQRAALARAAGDPLPGP